MATTMDQMASSYPLTTHRFKVSVGSDDMFFSNVSGLEIGHQTIEYKDGTGGWFQMPGQRDALNITLRKGIMPKQSQLYDWFASISLGTVEKKDVSISLTDESGSTLFVTWNIVDAFPTAMTQPSLDASSNEEVIEELSLMALRTTVVFH